MTHPAADLVRATWTGSGTTSPITLSGPAAGFQAFPTSLNGLTVGYSIQNQENTEKEAGFGVYSSTGPTLTRQFRTYPALGGAAVAFSVSSEPKLVFLTKIAIWDVPNIATVDPGVNDDITTGFVAPFSTWFNSVSKQLFWCADHTDGAAIWRRFVEPGDISGAGLAAATTVTGTSDSWGVGHLRKWTRYTNAGAITLTIGDVEDNFEGVAVRGGAGSLTLVGSGVTLNGGANYIVTSAAFVKREGSGTNLAVFELSTSHRVLQIVNTGALTVTEAHSGKTIIHTGAAQTFTFTGSGLGTGCYGVIHNTGSGAITVSTDRTLKGSSSIAANASATWEDDGTRLWVRAT